MQLSKMANPPARILLSGFPGSGKTGALASLANAGWKLRILDFDGNYEVLKHHVRSDADVDIVTFEDPLRMGNRTMGPDGVPTAFIDADRILDRWRYKDGDNWVDLGASRQWGEDTIVCLDGLTGLGLACWYKAQVLTNIRSDGDQRRVYQLAADEQLAFIRRLTAASNRYHFICISHLKLIGPPEIARNDEQPIQDAKRMAGEAIPTRLYPTAVGRQLSQNIAGEFSTHIRAIAEEVNGKVRRSIHYLPAVEVDLKIPVAQETISSLGRLEAASGLVKILEGLGHTPPKVAGAPKESNLVNRVKPEEVRQPAAVDNPPPTQ